MPLKVDYLLRETGSNLRRNVTLTIASIVTVLVSLTLVGVALLIRQGVANTNQKWKGGVELIIYMDPAVTPEQRDALGDNLDKNPAVKKTEYLDQDAAYEEFLRLFKDSPEFTEEVEKEILPTSYKVVPEVATTDSVQQIKGVYDDYPGVLKVVTALDTLKTMESLTGAVSLTVAVAAFVLLVIAVLLIFNTIRMAMFARRREIEVMKLVGATNWFIRVPYMLEGLVHGLVGASLAVAALFGYQRLTSQVIDQKRLELLSGFVVHTSDVVGTSVLITIIGTLVGVIGSGLASSRFLDV
jgi:cell division transport system permease protein